MNIPSISSMPTMDFSRFSNTIFSKIDRRIAAIAVCLFAAVGAVAYYLYNRKASHIESQTNDDVQGTENKSSPITLKKTFKDIDIKKAAQEGKLWIVIRGKVYDITKFRDLHPGGEEVLLQYEKNHDATKDFDDVGHSDEAKKMRDDYYIGDYVAPPKRTPMIKV